jgi:FHS family L-fucose permease-like MFS transporter
VVSKDSFEKAQKVLEGKITPGLGINAAVAGILVGIYWLLMLVGRLTGGSLGARFSSKAMMTFVTALGSIFILLAILLPTSLTVDVTKLTGSTTTILIPINVIFMILCGLCTSVMWGGIFNLAVEGLGKYTAAASGIFMVMVCGGGIVPLIQGYVADIAGYLSSYWVMLICILYMLYYALIGSKNVNKDIPVEA